MEHQIRALWAQVLDSEQSDFTSDTNFFEYGGDSVAAIRFVSLAHKSGISIDAQTVFEHPVLSDLASLCTSIEEKPATTEKTAQPPIGKGLLESWHLVNKCILQCGVDASSIEDIMPCTPYQAEVMTASHEFGCWVFQAVFELEAGSEDRARRTFEVLRQKTPIFRTSIAQHEMDLYQVVLNDDIAWQEEAISLQTYKARESNRRISYGDPTSRYAIIRDDGKKYFVWTMTHAIYDRWSKILFFPDIMECFQDPDAFSRKPNRPLFGKFVDFVTSKRNEEAIASWLNQLDGLSRYDLLFKPSMNREFITKPNQPVITSIKYDRLRNTSITISTISHVAWAMVLANEAAYDDIFYPSIRSCRQMALPEVDEIIGPLFSLVPTRIRLKAEQSLEDLLRTVQDAMVAGTPYEPFGVQALQEHFGHKRYSQSLFVYEPPLPDSFSASVEAEEESGVTSRLRAAAELNTQTRVPAGLILVLTPKGDDLGIWVRYDENFIDAARILSLVENLKQILNHFLTKPWKNTQVRALCPHLAPSSTSADSVERVAKPKQKTPQDQLTHGDSTNKATLTGLFHGVSKAAPAIILPEGSQRSISYAQLYEDVISFQRDLAALGIHKGLVVSCALPNSYELVVAFLATTWQRGIVAPLNPGYRQEEFDFYIDDMDVALILTPRGSHEQEGPVVAAATKRGTAIAECYWDGEKITLDLRDKGKLASQERQETTVAQEDDVALILHTSGTTGAPKAVPLTHRNLVSSMDNICRTYQLTEDDRTMLIMPLFHVHGLLASFLAPLRSGGTIILPSRLNPTFWEHFTEYRASWYTATPTMHRIILQFPPPNPLPSIRFIRSCSSQLPPSLFHQLQERFKAPVLESYAMTEASHLMTSNPLPPAKRLPGCVGRAADGVEVAILDTVGEAVPQGEEGEVCIRGENVTKGYRRNPAANESSFTKTGFFRTGDQGKLDEEHYLTLTGRIKELINKGGEKISPVELDNVIAQHEAVAEVVCFAIDDDMYDQDVGCAIRLEEGQELKTVALKRWVGQHVAAYKVPRKIWFMDEIPKTPTGKVQRKMVAEVVSKMDIH